MPSDVGIVTVSPGRIRAASAILDGVTSSDDRGLLARDLVAAAFLRGDFVLSSGAHSSFYIDKYLFETKPDILRRIAEQMEPMLPGGCDRLAGTELGAVALAAALSLRTGLPFVIPRKTTKDYSTAKAIEGELHNGDRVAVIEDIVTSGAQSIRAADALAAAGAQVLGIYAVVDREEGGAEKISAAGYPFEALFRLRDLPV